MGFSRQEHFTGLPRPPPGDLPDPGIGPGSPALQVDSLLSEPPGKCVSLMSVINKATTYMHLLWHTVLYMENIGEI